MNEDNDTLLTILIPALQERRQIRDRLVNDLIDQIDNVHPIKVELMISEDNRTEVYGTKLNQMMVKAKGRYLCNIDDDDRVAGCYVIDIVNTLLENPDVDLITFKSLRVDIAEVLDFGFHNTDRDPRPLLPNGLAVKANHLAVWRKEIATSVKLPNVFFRESLKRYGMGPEVKWYYDLYAKYKDSGLKEIHINKILYLYFYDPVNTTSVP